MYFIRTLVQWTHPLKSPYSQQSLLEIKNVPLHQCNKTVAWKKPIKKRAFLGKAKPASELSSESKSDCSRFCDNVQDDTSSQSDQRECENNHNYSNCSRQNRVFIHCFSNSFSCHLFHPLLLSISMR